MFYFYRALKTIWKEMRREWSFYSVFVLFTFSLCLAYYGVHCYFRINAGAWGLLAKDFISFGIFLITIDILDFLWNKCINRLEKHWRKKSAIEFEKVWKRVEKENRWGSFDHFNDE